MPHAQRLRLHILAGLFLGPLALPTRAQPRPLMLASHWRNGTDVRAYWVSEKLDGLRGYWDGNNLWTRGGHLIHAPAWFTAGWPAHPLDGELWAGRGLFEEATSTVRQQSPDHAAWRRIRFMVFDMPEHGGPFTARLEALQRLRQQPGTPQWLQVIEQFGLMSEAELHARLKEVLARGGEGLMLHHQDGRYQGERSAHLLKLKALEDAEARVIGHLPGKGQHEGRLGALLVEMPPSDGHAVRRFRLGSGLSQRERENPPPVGALVSFRYRGLTASGLPRFASYWRVRPEE